MEAINQLAAVLTVLSAVAALAWWARRRRGFALPGLPLRKTGKYLQPIERLPLGPHQTLHLIKLGEKALLIASSGSSSAILDSVDWRTLTNRGDIVE
ncbi:MAG: flagellar biosynthetic protein FliO [Acidobacteriia bacterium]|nr:flagellar biosynthetic protein FliO [Terriglobia bacterium]